MMHGSGMMDGMSMMSPLMWIFMILLWGFAILGVVCAVKWLLARARPGPAEKKETPLDILTARYAKGEISREEFVKMKKDLE